MKWSEPLTERRQFGIECPLSSQESGQRLVFDRWLGTPVLHFLARKLSIEIGLLTDRQRTLECQHLLLVVDLDRAGKDALGALL